MLAVFNEAGLTLSCTEKNHPSVYPLYDVTVKF